LTDFSQHFRQFKVAAGAGKMENVEMGTGNASDLGPNACEGHSSCVLIAGIMSFSGARTSVTPALRKTMDHLECDG